MMDANSRVTFAKPDGSIVPHQLMWVIQFVALAGPHFPYRRQVSALAIVLCAIWLNITPHFTNDKGEMQPYALAWAFYMGTLDKLLLCDSAGPEASFWRRGQPQEAKGFMSFGFQKIKWAFLLIFGVRGVGWNFEVKNTPPGSRTTRWRFAAGQAVEFVYHLLAADLFVHLGMRMWYTSPAGVIGDVDSLSLTLRSSSWSTQFINCIVWGCLPYHAIQMQYTLCAAVAVALGLSEPKDWPSFFGPLSNVTTVRAFWGEYWHQTARKAMNGLTGAFVDLAGIRRGTNASSYTQLWLAFSISAIMHALQMRMFPAPIQLTVGDKMIGMLQFFIWQAAAITFEDFGQWLWRKSGGKTEGPSVLRTTVGYCWVVLSFWYSIPFAADVMLRMRAMEDSPLPFSVFKPLIFGNTATI